jgi:hypothetical protein
MGLALAEATLAVAALVSPEVDYFLTPGWHRIIVPDDELGFRMSPYYPGNDAEGFRNESIPDTCEVVTIGDSVTYGFAAQPEEAWPRQLEDRLGTCVHNVSCGGYGPVEYRVLLARALELEPRTVLLGMHSGVGGDFLDAYESVYTDGRFPELRTADATLEAELARLDRETPFRQSKPLRTPRPPETLREWVSAHSRLWGLGRELFPILAGGQFVSIIHDDDSPLDTYELGTSRPWSFPFEGEDGFRTVFRQPRFLIRRGFLEDPRFREGRRITGAVLVDMQRRLAERDVRFVVVIVPSKEVVLESLIESRPELSELLPAIAVEEQITRQFQRFLDRHGIPFLDTTEALRAGFARGVRLYPETGDVHPNAAGYTLIADAVAAFLGANR